MKTRKLPRFLAYVLAAAGLWLVNPASLAADDAVASEKAAPLDGGGGAAGEGAPVVDFAASVMRAILPPKQAEFMVDQFKVIEMLDPYGVTGQMPRGWAYVKWDWTMIKAKDRYDAHRHLQGAVLPPFDLGGTIYDLGVGGSGGGHTFQVSYGLTGMLDWYIEIPFTYMDVGFGYNPKTEEGWENAKGFLSDYYAARGSPAMQGFKGSWMMGDINTGVSWNIYRNQWYSVGLTPRVYFPTGHIPDPNRSFTYASGPELEIGIGGWAFGFTQGYDVRLKPRTFLPWMDIIASSEFGFSYALPQRREYPDNYLTQASILLPAFGGVMPETPADWDQGKTDFGYRPGIGLSWTGQLNFNIGPVGFGGAYGIKHTAMAEIYDAHPAFEAMAKALELTGTQTLHAVQLACSVNVGLLMVGFQWQKAVDGFNAIVFDDYYQLTIKGFFPVGPFDTSEEVKRYGEHRWGL